VLRGEFTNALKLTATLKLKAAAEIDLRSVLTVEAQARAGVGDHEGARGARQQIAGFHDKTKDPAAWAAAQQMVAYAFESLGRESETESTLHETLAVLQKVRGPEHLDTLTSRTRLGLSLRRQQKNKESESTHLTVSEICRRVLGPQHRLTLSSMSHVANAIAARGKGKEAEAAHREVLLLRESTSARSTETPSRAALI
jgi:hypothetical protein